MNEFDIKSAIKMREWTKINDLLKDRELSENEKTDRLISSLIILEYYKTEYKYIDKYIFRERTIREAFEKGLINEEDLLKLADYDYIKILRFIKCNICGHLLDGHFHIEGEK